MMCKVIAISFIATILVCIIPYFNLLNEGRRCDKSL